MPVREFCATYRDIREEGLTHVLFYETSYHHARSLALAFAQGTFLRFIEIEEVRA